MAEVKENEILCKAHDGMLAILYEVAKSGLVTPVEFVGALRLVPGYDIGKALMIENQWFGNDGFPRMEPGE